MPGGEPPGGLRLPLKIRGIVGTFFLLFGLRARKSSSVPRVAALLIGCHRRLRRDTRVLSLRVPPKSPLSADEHSGNGRDTRPQHGSRRLHIAAARWSTRTLTRCFPRASPLDERCTVVDTVPIATRTPPRVPLRARAEKSPHSSVRLEETPGGALLLAERS